MTKRVCASTNEYVLLAVHGSTWQYMAVQYIFLYVLIPCWYVLVRPSTNFMAVLLDFAPENFAPEAPEALILRLKR
jgi:hypothetical protein